MSPALLRIDRIEVVYSHVILALREVSLQVSPGQVVALLGANGAGKTTTLKAASNLLTAERGAITRGTVTLEGSPVIGLRADELVARGVVQVLEGRHCFASLSIDENLRTGGFARQRTSAALTRQLDRVYTYFPRLKSKRRLLAGYASGGEQQMVAIGRALMSEPRLMLLDEPSMGLAPLVVEEIFEIVRTLNTSDGVTFLLAEQNTMMALRYADYGYILETGRVALEGSADELRARDDVKSFYLGLKNDNRTDFRVARERRREIAWSE